MNMLSSSRGVLFGIGFGWSVVLVVGQPAPVPPPGPRLDRAADGQTLPMRTDLDSKEPQPQTSGNKPIPRIQGETVYVRVSDLGGEVDGTHEVDNVPREVLVPVFAASKTRPSEVIDVARPRVFLDDLEFSEITPVATPFAIEGLPRGVKVVWLSATVSPADAERFAQATGTTLRVSYRQPLLLDRFLYSLILVPGHERPAAKRNWPFQMFVRSTDRLLQPPEPPADSQHLGDILVVYLRDRQLVDLAIPPRKRTVKSP
jgi:hypothetical protein